MLSKPDARNVNKEKPRVKESACTHHSRYVTKDTAVAALPVARACSLVRLV